MRGLASREPLSRTPASTRPRGRARFLACVDSRERRRPSSEERGPCLHGRHTRREETQRFLFQECRYFDGRSLSRDFVQAADNADSDQRSETWDADKAEWRPHLPGWNGRFFLRNRCRARVLGVRNCRGARTVGVRITTRQKPRGQSRTGHSTPGLPSHENSPRSLSSARTSRFCGRLIDHGESGRL